jgi:PAS domain S-box-containing protein
MAFTFHEELIWFVAAFALPAWLGVQILLGERSKAEVTYGWLLVSQCLWILGQATELSVQGVLPKLWLDGLQYYPMCASGALHILFGHRFASSAPPKGLLPTYVALSFVTATFYAAAPLHGLARQDAHIIAGEPFDALHYRYAPGDILLTSMLLGSGIYATFVMIAYLRKVGRAQLETSAPIVLGLSLPTLIGVASSFLDLRILGQRDISFAVFGLGGMCVSWGVRNRRAVVTVPIARDMVFDRIPDAALVLDRGGTIVDLNQAALSILGVGDVKAAEGRRVEAMGDAILSLDSLKSLKDGQQTIVSTKDESRYFALTYHAQSDLGAHLYLLRDVTDQEKARRLLLARRATLEAQVAVGSKQLEDTERKFRAIFEQSFQFIGLLDPRGTLLESNEAALRLIDATPEDVIGKPFWETPWWNHSPAQKQRLEEACLDAAAGNFVRFESTHQGRDGKMRQVDFSLKPVFDGEGRVTMMIPEGRDITDLRAAEQQLMQAQKMEALGSLAGGVAHDFNNLLTVIGANLELIREHIQDPMVLESIEECRDAASTAASLTHQLLAFGRKSAVVPKVLDVKQQLGQSTTMLRRLLGGSVTVSLELKGELGSIVFDEAQLKQILMNLAINARDAMPEGGALVISAKRVRRARPEERDERDWLEVDVTDTGTGISQETQARIFEPFFTTKEIGKGTGLGLSMVYGALQQNGGFVELDSVLGKGTRFSLFFVAAEPPHGSFHPVALGTGFEVAEGTRAYLVEDEPLVRNTVQRMLERMGFEVLSFPGPLSLLAQKDTLPPPGLLVTDAMMPQMTGFELLPQLSAVWPHVPTIMISGHAAEKSVRGVERRGVRFLAKPFSVSELGKIVAEAMGPKTAG